MSCSNKLSFVKVFVTDFFSFDILLTLTYFIQKLFISDLPRVVVDVVVVVVVVDVVVVYVNEK